MANMSSGNEMANGIAGIERNVIRRSASATPLRDDAISPLLAPTSTSGCISDISSDAMHGRVGDYATAIKNYSRVYAHYQAYLMPVEQMQPHDYDMATKPVPEFSHIGCLHADLLDSTLLNDEISDDDIECCGYMAWVHH